MTARRAPQNGAPVAEPPAPEPPAPEPRSIEERLAALEQNQTRMAQGLAALLAQQMQPQVQQGILSQLLGGLPDTP